jgi:FdhD protein
VPDVKIFDTDCMMKNLRQFYAVSLLHKQTAGVHRASLCSDAGTLLTAIDIGRHNAIDKVLGMALINQIERTRTYLITSGRVNSDAVKKAVRAGVQMLVSRAAPTAKAIDDAKIRNLTLIGFAREDRFNVYCGEQRLTECTEVTT